jgi:hypothetical protein
MPLIVRRGGLKVVAYPVRGLPMIEDKDRVPVLRRR